MFQKPPSDNEVLKLSDVDKSSSPVSLFHVGHALVVRVACFDIPTCTVKKGVRTIHP